MNVRFFFIVSCTILCPLAEVALAQNPAQETEDASKAFILLEDPDIDEDTQVLLEKEQKLLEELNLKSDPPKIEEASDSDLSEEKEPQSVSTSIEEPPVDKKQPDHDIDLPLIGRKVLRPDLPVATVTAHDAALRAGPGKENTRMYQLPRGLQINIETRKDDWYRILTPSGMRGWIASQDVLFGKDGNSAPTKTVRIKGYDSSLEQK